VVDLTRGGFLPYRFPTREEPDMVRVLVTVEPRMYREAIALAVQRNRPNSEVMLLSEDVLDGQVVVLKDVSGGDLPCSKA
jgi:hypothetical protein